MPDSAPYDHLSYIPALYAKNYKVDNNYAEQLIYPEQKAEIVEDSGKFYANLTAGKFRILSHEEDEDINKPFLRGSVINNSGDLKAEDCKWDNQPSQNTSREVLDSLEDKFQFKKEGTGKPGLREPQIGALYAISANWTTSKREPVSVVMPTGTGKTDTMVAAFAAHQLNKLLVIVPSDALRNQISSAFEKYGVLQKLNVVSAKAKKPIVGKLQHGFDSKLGAKGFAAACNVIITTPQALNQNKPEVRNEFIKQFTHLFIDEAHHTPASTWNEIKDMFSEKRVVQFTATPFREDGKRLSGQIIYKYPLTDAQKNGYFARINYVSIVDFDDTDRAIAKRAIKALDDDLATGKDHLLMARVNTKKRANELFDLYEELAPGHKPIVLHSSIKSNIRTQRINELIAHESKIVICVDMLGEGFDLPELKIAAIHDPHKSLGVTLQFIGRFTRVGSLNIGDATAVVARGERNIDHRLKDLYAEQADWNKVIRNLSADAIEEQQELTDFENDFNDLPEEISIRNLTPKMSSVVYSTSDSEWHPEKISEIYKKSLISPPSINHSEHVAWFVTKDVEDVRWGNIKSVVEVSYCLFVIYWNPTERLCYIYSSKNEGVYKELAENVVGESAKLFRGPVVYRSMAYLKRRIAINVGLKDARNQDSIFELRVGRNVIGALDEEARRTKSQTNIFAHGIDEKSGKKISVGASLKGRVWSYKAATSLRDWMRWADYVGAKLKDNSIDPNEVMDGFIAPEILETRPLDLTVLAVEWPSDTYLETSESVEVQIGDSKASFVDVELTVTENNKSGDIPFKVTLPDGSSATYKIRMNDGKMTFTAVENEAFYVRPRSNKPLQDLFNKIGLRILLEKEAVIEPYMVLLVPKTAAPAYRKSLLKTLDWNGIDITKEVQEGAQDSVQFKTTEYIKELEEWDVIINDDGAGEIADIVALKKVNNTFMVNLLHCKASSSATPGARVEDLYELCGQAQKSIARRRDPQLMLERIIQREKKRRKRGVSGFIVGNESTLLSLADDSPLLEFKFTITVVQPGVSKERVSNQQLELIAATEKYVKDSGGNTPLVVIVNQ